MTFAGVVALLFVGAFALGMAALLVLGFKNVWRAVASRGWPTAPGVVAKVDLTTSTSSSSSRKTSSTTYAAELTIRYRVDRHEHATDQIRWGQTLGSGDPAEALVLALRYPEGQPVTVHYNPAHPEEAVVKPGLTGSAFLLPGAALVFLLFLLPAGAMIWRMFLSSGSPRASVAPDLSRYIRVFLGVPVLMGAAMLAHGARNLVLASQCRNWPTAPGVWIRDLTPDRIPNLDTLREHRGFDYVYRYETRAGARYQCQRWFGQGTATGNDSDAEITREFPR
jgi:hypothetical protein